MPAPLDGQKGKLVALVEKGDLDAAAAVEGALVGRKVVVRGQRHVVEKALGRVQALPCVRLDRGRLLVIGRPRGGDKDQDTDQLLGELKARGVRHHVGHHLVVGRPLVVGRRRVCHGCAVRGDWRAPRLSRLVCFVGVGILSLLSQRLVIVGFVFWPSSRLLLSSGACGFGRGKKG